MGLSNGGFMSYRMAHDHSDLITGIVPFAGVGLINGQILREPVSILHIHGTKDRTIKWAGGGVGDADTQVQRIILPNGKSSITVKRR